MRPATCQIAPVRQTGDFSVSGVLYRGLLPAVTGLSLKGDTFNAARDMTFRIQAGYQQVVEITFD